MKRESKGGDGGEAGRSMSLPNATADFEKKNSSSHQELSLAHKMRNRNVLNLRKSLPCMSWSPKNLYNVWKQTVGPKSAEITFKNTTEATLFQQRWKSKAAVRAYHGDFIPEKSFKRWYLPDNLPDVRPRRKVVSGDDKADLEEYACRKVREKELADEIEEKGLAPVGSLMFTEVERRLDVFVFRCCFAHSVYEARRLVIHGDVMLNGKKHSNANTRLAPGDMISVNPEAIRFFKPQNSDYDDVGQGANRPITPFRHQNALSEGEKAEPTSTVSKPEENSSSSIAESTSTQEASTSESAVNEEKSGGLTPFYLPAYASPWLFIPAFIEVSFATCSAIYVRHPTARPGYSEIPTPYDADGALIRYAWEWYMQRRPRMRSKSQLARMPEDRAITKLQEIHEQRTLLQKSLRRTMGTERPKGTPAWR